MNLINNTAIERVSGAAAAAQTAINSSLVDMKGYDTVTFLVSVNDMADTAAITATAQGGALADGSDAANLADAVATYTATSGTSGDAKLLIVEVIRPRTRYVRLRITRGTADSSLDCVLALKSKPVSAPVAQGAGVLASASALSPAAA